MVWNEGTDSLVVSSVSSDTSVFVPDTTSFVLDPGDSLMVGVSFAPVDTGAVEGVLTFASNDPDEATVTVVLQGMGIYPPDITVSPDSFAVTLSAGDSTSEVLTIGNVGDADLTFEIIRAAAEVVGFGRKATEEIPFSRPSPGYTMHRTPERIFDGSQVLLIQDAAPWGSVANETVLDANGIAYDVINSSSIAGTDFMGYRVVLVASDQPTSFYTVVASNQSKFDTYVGAGGVLEFHAAGWGWNSGDASLVTLPGGMGIVHLYATTNYLLVPDHPLVEGVLNLRMKTFE